MTPREQAIEAVRQMLSQTWYDGRSDRYSDTMPNLAESLVAQITPLLTADLQAAIADLQDDLARYMAFAGDESERADAAEARERQAIEAINGLLEWDRARKFIAPYRVRDPLIAAALRTGAKP